MNNTSTTSSQLTASQQLQPQPQPTTSTASALTRATFSFDPTTSSSQTLPAASSSQSSVTRFTTQSNLTPQPTASKTQNTLNFSNFAFTPFRFGTSVPPTTSPFKFIFSDTAETATQTSPTPPDLQDSLSHTPTKPKSAPQRTMDQYQTIAMQNTYEALSFEEVRLVDYAQGRKPYICAPAKRGYRPNSPLVDTVPITLRVGKSMGVEKRFVVMKQYLVSVSPHFESILCAESTNSLSPPKDVVILDDVMPAIFGIFHEWLLSRTLLNRNCQDFCSTDGYADILRTYIFAYKYDVPQLRRDAIDAFGWMRTLRRYLPSVEVVGIAYAELPETSPMLGLIVDMYATNWGPDADGSENNPNILYEKLPKRFFFDLAANACRRILSGKTSWVWKTCDYHHD